MKDKPGFNLDDIKAGMWLQAALVRSNASALVNYYWDPDTGLARFEYENADGHRWSNERVQKRWWVPPEERSDYRERLARGDFLDEEGFDEG